MSVVFDCGCGRRTTEPFIINNEKMCVVCAEEIAPRLVERRAKYNYERYQVRQHDVDRSRYGRHY